MQVWPAPQALPQVPQLKLSFAVLAQYGEAADGVHFAREPQVSVQTPLLHTWPAPQTLPQVPQSALSVAVFAQ
jgi:hypothetical protein